MKLTIDIDENEIQTTGVRSYASQNCWVIYETDETGKSLSELYSVLKVPSERWNKEDFGEYITILERDDSVICAYITQSGSEIGIDNEILVSKITRTP